MGAAPSLPLGQLVTSESSHLTRHTEKIPINRQFECHLPIFPSNMAHEVADRQLQVAELGKPLRSPYGLMKPLWVSCGKQWLLGPMWFMNIITILLIIVPGYFWFASVWQSRTQLERFLIAPGLFIAIIASYASTSWLDPGIVQPGHFAEIEGRLRMAAGARASQVAESLADEDSVELGQQKSGNTHRSIESTAQRWDFNPRHDLSYKMRDCDNIEYSICPICGVPQPRGKQVVHVS